MSTHAGPTFATYDLRTMPANGVYGLANGLLPEMARTLGYKLGDRPTEEALRGFIKLIGPAKFLQDNIALVQQRLGTDRDAVGIAAGWVERSGVLALLDRSFVNPDLQAPDEIDVIITGGACRWELRRMEELIRQIANKRQVGRVFLVAGNRVMAASEHHLVAAYWVRHGYGPMESDIMEHIIAPWLRFLKLDVRVIAVPSDLGREVMVSAAVHANVVNRPVIVVSNAPAGVLDAGQLRRALRAIDPDYDRDGDRLFVLTDSIEVARHGEGPATYQNPFTALGQIARNALHIHLEQLSLTRN